MNVDLVVSWKRLSTALLLVALASTVTLAIVVSVRDVEVLSTVALALAVLAFAAQLASSVVQGQAASQVMQQSERLNNETRSLLTEIRATTIGLRGTVENQFGALLHHVLGDSVQRAVREAGGSQVEGDRLEQKLLQNINASLDAYITGADPGGEYRPRRDLLDLGVGELVKHPTLGIGRVVAIEGDDPERAAKVVFPGDTEVKLLLAWAPLRRVAGTKQDRDAF